MREPVELCNADLKKSIFKDVMFMSIAEGGAMGEPGAIWFYQKSGVLYHCNYAFGDIKIDKVEKLFPTIANCEFGMFGLDSSVPEGWNYVNLGMGNHLIVNDSVYGRFVEQLGDIEELSAVYMRWMEIADNILNGQ